MYVLFSDIHRHFSIIETGMVSDRAELDSHPSPDIRQRQGQPISYRFTVHNPAMIARSRIAVPPLLQHLHLLSFDMASHCLPTRFPNP